jgi:erythromycin esterase
MRKFLLIIVLLNIPFSILSKNKISIINFDNFSFIDSIAKKNSIIFIGESNHFVEEFNLLKFNLIKYLHKNFGYDVLLYEMSNKDLCALNYYKNYNKELYFKSVSDGIWNFMTTKSTGNFYKYLYDSTSIKIHGIDYQQVSRNKGLNIKLLFNSLSNKNPTLLKFNSLLYYDSLLMEHDLKFNNYYKTEFDRRKNKYKVFVKNNDSSSSIKSYWKNHQMLIDSFSFWINLFKLSAIDTMKEELVNSFENSLLYYKQGKIKLIDFDNRDFEMAKNILYYKNQYKGKKIIVLAHNSHISKIKVNKSNDKSIGMFLTKEIKNNAYFLSLNYNMISPQKRYWDSIPHSDNSIERKMAELGNTFFINLHQNCKLIKKKYTFSNAGDDYDSKPILPYKGFDGMIFINNVNYTETPMGRSGFLNYLIY